MELHPSTSKHWLNHTPHAQHFAPLHQLVGWYHHRWEQTKPAPWSRDSSLFWHLSGGTNSEPMSGQQESLSSLSKINYSIPENYSRCNTVNNAKSSLLRTVYRLLKPDSRLGANCRIKSYIDLRDYHFSDSRCNSTSDITLTQLVWTYDQTCSNANLQWCSNTSLSSPGSMFMTQWQTQSNNTSLCTVTFLCMLGNLVWVSEDSVRFHSVLPSHETYAVGKPQGGQEIPQLLLLNMQIGKIWFQLNITRH